MFNRWNRSKQIRRQAAELYARAVEAARQPELYQNYEIADTVDGRFDAVLLHVFILVDALATLGPETLAVQRQFQEVMVSDLDRSLREAGAGDLSVGKQVLTMASACRGRLMAYADAIKEEGDQALIIALAHNVYRAESHPKALNLARYVQQCRDLIAGRHVAALAAQGIPVPENASA